MSLMRMRSLAHIEDDDEARKGAFDDLDLKRINSELDSVDQALKDCIRRSRQVLSGDGPNVLFQRILIKVRFVAV